jgi:hypothetical protein
MTYWIIAILAALMTLWGARSLAESRASQRRRFDITGTLTLAAGISSLVAALTEGPTDWSRPDVVILLAGAVALFAGFGWAEWRAADPMLDLSLLRRPSFVASITGALAMGIGVIGLMTYVPNDAQTVSGLDPLQSALILGVWSGCRSSPHPRHAAWPNVSAYVTGSPPDCLSVRWVSSL